MAAEGIKQEVYMTYSINPNKITTAPEAPTRRPATLSPMGLGQIPVVTPNIQFNDAYPQYSDELKALLQRAFNPTFSGQPPVEEEEGVAKFDRLKYLQSVKDLSLGEPVSANVPSVSDLSLGETIEAPTQTMSDPTTAEIEIDRMELQGSFYEAIKVAEGQHGKKDAGYSPTPTNDDGEKSIPIASRSKDVGYGHKVKDSETAAKQIYGIPFIDEGGSFIPLTEEQVVTIYSKDMEYNLKLARKSGWDARLKDLDTTWEQLSEQYKLPLMSLAYNLGGSNAAKEFKLVLKAAKEGTKNNSAENILNFAKELRRKENDKNTAGMDNRVVKELKGAGLIKSSSEVKSVLKLTTEK